MYGTPLLNIHLSSFINVTLSGFRLVPLILLDVADKSYNVSESCGHFTITSKQFPVMLVLFYAIADPNSYFCSAI